MSIPTLLTVNQFAQKHQTWSESALRWKIFRAEQNGLLRAGAIVRDGGRVLINEERWFAHILKSNQEGANNPIKQPHPNKFS